LSVIWHPLSRCGKDCRQWRCHKVAVRGEIVRSAAGAVE
jgi:hypothetical protein